MTASTITYSLSRNCSWLMPGVSFAHRIDQAAGQTRDTLARRYGR